MAVDEIVYQMGRVERSHHVIQERAAAPMDTAPSCWHWVGAIKRCHSISQQGVCDGPPKNHWEEHKRMKENKKTSFIFLIEEEKMAEALRVEAQLEAEGRRAEEAQQKAEARRAEE